MSQTYAQIQASVAVALQDSTVSGQTASNATWPTAELDSILPEVLTLISRKVPYMVKHVLLADGTTRKLILSSADQWKLIWGDMPKWWVEYEVAKEPEDRKNCRIESNTIYLDVSALPAVSDVVYIHLGHKHLLQSALGTTDSAGAVKTQAVVGATSLVLKSLGTGTVNEDTKLTIAGDTTIYHVTSTATIATNEATVSICPGLMAAVAVDAVVTLAAENTLISDLESIIVPIWAGLAVIRKGRDNIGNNTAMGGGKWTDWVAWGKETLNDGMVQLNKMVRVPIVEDYSRLE